VGTSIGQELFPKDRSIYIIPAENPSSRYQAIYALWVNSKASAVYKEAEIGPL
jgi:hypothetical protein